MSSQPLAVRRFIDCVHASVLARFVTHASPPSTASSPSLLMLNLNPRESLVESSPDPPQECVSNSLPSVGPFKVGSKDVNAWGQCPGWKCVLRKEERLALNDGSETRPTTSLVRFTGHSFEDLLGARKYQSSARYWSRGMVGNLSTWLSLIRSCQVSASRSRWDTPTQTPSIAGRPRASAQSSIGWNMLWRSCGDARCWRRITLTIP